jgi:hypothetical protein
MSALQTLVERVVMSGFVPKADIMRRSKITLLDHLVSGPHDDHIVGVAKALGITVPQTLMRQGGRRRVRGQAS